MAMTTRAAKVCKRLSHVDGAGADGRFVFDDEDARFVRQGRTDLKVLAAELAGG